MNHDPILIRKHGDDLEKYWAERILTSIPSYATMWATYVGNDGQQEALPMSKSNADAEEERIIIWQWLYTLFESMALAWEIEHQFKKREAITEYKDYASNLNAWIAFYAHLGRIHDMAEKLTNKLNQNNLFAPFDPFYEQRHIALHGIKVPMRWVENVLCAPTLGEKPKEWHTQLNWGELKKADFEFLSTHISGTLRELEKVVEGFCAQVFQLLPGMGLSPVLWPKMEAVVESKPAAKAIPFAGTQSCAPYEQSGIQNISGFSGIQDVPGGLD